jgi:hypothetical protein
VATILFSHSSTLSRPTTSVAHELVPGNRKWTSGASIRSVGRISPWFRARRFRLTTFLANHDLTMVILLD